MQVLLNTDPNVDGRQGMAEHLDSVVKHALRRFGDHVTRVEAHLSDSNSIVKAHPDDIHCTLEARVSGLEPVIVKDHADTAHQAIHGAVGKLKRALDTALAKHDPKRHAALPADLVTDEVVQDLPG